MSDTALDASTAPARSGGTTDPVLPAALTATEWSGGGRWWSPALGRATSSFPRAATLLATTLAALTAVVTFLVSSATPPSWESTTEVAPQLSLLDGGTGINVFSLNIDGAKRFIDAQVVLLEGRDVLEPVARSARMPLDELADRVEVEAGESGATVIVTTRDADPRRARAITTAVIDSYRTVRAEQLRALAKTRFDAIRSQLDEQRRLGLSTSELALQLQRDLAAVLVPLNAGPAAALTVVSSPETDPAPQGSTVKALIAFVATAVLVGSLLLLRRATGDRVIDPQDLMEAVGTGPTGVTVLGLLRRHDVAEVSAAHATALLALSTTAPSEVLVLSAVPEPLDQVGATALVDGLHAAGRPAQLLLSAGPGETETVGVRPLGWATQLPEDGATMPPDAVLCLVLMQGMHRAEVRASVISIRQVSALPIGLLLLQGRTLP